MKDNATIGDTVRTDIKRELDARNQAQVQLIRLQEGLSGYQGQAFKLKGEIDEAVKGISVLVAEGSSPVKAQANVMKLKAELGGLQDISFQIEENSLPQAREHLREAQGQLEGAVKAAMAPIREATQKEIGKVLSRIMDKVDTFNAESREAYQSLKTNITAATGETMLKVVHDSFYRFARAAIQPAPETWIPLPERPPTPQTPPEIPPPREPSDNGIGDVADTRDTVDDGAPTFTGRMTVTSPGDKPEQHAEKG